MAKSWNKTETWLALIALGVGAVIAAVFGLHTYMTSTATPLHSDAGKVASVSAGEPSPSWTETVSKARQIVRSGVAEQNLPGVSVAVGVGGELVWAEGFGWADLEGRIPVKPDTRFRIGTASTVLTSAAVGLLLEKGLLKLDDPVQTLVPEFPKHNWPVTLRQVLGHTAGLGTDGGDESQLYGEHCDRPADALPQFADDDLRYEPGTRYRYSNYGWIIASAAIERAARESFHRVMREQVFEPLGMEHTREDPGPESSATRATPYFPRYAADPRYGPDPMRPVDTSCYAGAAVFVSTPSDLVRFGMALEDGKLLRPETVRELQTSQRLTSGEETGYGLGWDLETVTLAGQQVQVVGDDGQLLGGPLSSLMIFRDRDLVVAVLSNTSYADTAGLGLKIAEAFATRTTP